MTASAARELRELAGRARRLPPPSSHRPEAFHEARDELARAIDQVATDLDARPLETRSPGIRDFVGQARRRIEATSIEVAGRTIPVQRRRGAFGL